MDYIRISQQASVAEFKVQDVKELLKDWIKLYPDSFAPDVEFKIYQLADGDFIIELHEDLSSMAVALLVLYFETIRLQDYKTTSRQELVAEPVEATTSKVQQPIAYITIDDTEILLKQNEGKRAMVFSELGIASSQSNGRDVTPVASDYNKPTAVRFLLEDNYVLDYNFEGRPKPVKDSGLQFSEDDFNLPEKYESLRVGDVVKKKVDEFLDEGLTPKKMLIYLLCGVIGLSIGFLIVYFMNR